MLLQGYIDAAHDETSVRRQQFRVNIRKLTEAMRFPELENFGNFQGKQLADNRVKYAAKMREKLKNHHQKMI